MMHQDSLEPAAIRFMLDHDSLSKLLTLTSTEGHQKNVLQPFKCTKIMEKLLLLIFKLNQCNSYA